MGGACFHLHTKVKSKFSTNICCLANAICIDTTLPSYKLHRGGVVGKLSRGENFCFPPGSVARAPVSDFGTSRYTLHEPAFELLIHFNRKALKFPRYAVKHETKRRQFRVNRRLSSARIRFRILHTNIRPGSNCLS